MQKCFLEDILFVIENIQEQGIVDSDFSSITNKEGIEYEMLKKIIELTILGVMPSYIQHTVDLMFYDALSKGNLTKETIDRLLFLKSDILMFQEKKDVFFIYNFSYHIHNYAKTLTFSTMEHEEIERRLRKLKFDNPINAII